MKLLLAALVALQASAQEAPKKKPAAKKQAAHTKASPEQIRRFEQLEKKQKK